MGHPDPLLSCCFPSTACLAIAKHSHMLPGSLDLPVEHPRSHTPLHEPGALPLPCRSVPQHGLLHAMCGHVHNHRIVIPLPPILCVSKLHSIITCIFELHYVVLFFSAISDMVITMVYFILAFLLLVLQPIMALSDMFVETVTMVSSIKDPWYDSVTLKL